MSYFDPLLPLLLLLSLWSVLRNWRASSRKNRPWLQAISTIGILILSLNVSSWLFSRSLEIWYEQDPIPRSSADVIVVLGGYVSPPLPNKPYALAGRDTYIRLQRAIWLYKNWQPLPILACAGGPEPQWYESTIRHVLESEGIPQNLIWIDSQSRTTHENAVYGAEILRSHNVSRVVLVTDARSMPRAAASFEKQGIAVVPAPAEYTTLTVTLNDLVPNWRAIDSNNQTLHEIVGLVWYWLRGWI